MMGRGWCVSIFDHGSLDAIRLGDLVQVYSDPAGGWRDYVPIDSKTVLKDARRVVSLAPEHYRIIRGNGWIYEIVCGSERKRSAKGTAS
jgi:hypothetical protein